DGSKVALNLREEETDIWIWDFNRATLTRLSFDPGLDRFPVWSPDGRRIAYSSQYGGSLRGNLVWQATDGSGTVTRLADGGGAQVFPSSFSPDGSRIFVYGDDARTDQDNDDIGVVQLQGGQRVIPLLQTKFMCGHSRTLRAAVGRCQRQAGASPRGPATAGNCSSATAWR